MYHSGWFMRIGTLGFNLLILNILWFSFTIVGLGVFGLFPATVAMFSVMRDMIIKQDEQKVIKKFIESFKKDWFLSNVLGYMYSFVIFILYLNIRIIYLIETRVLYVVVMSATIIIAVVILLSFLYMFPIFVHLKYKWFEYPKYAFIVTIAKPFNSILLIALIALVVYIYSIFPVLIVLLGIGPLGYIVMKVASFSLPKNE